MHISMRMRERDFYNACVIMQSHELNNWVYFCSVVQFSKVEEEEWKKTFIEDKGASHQKRRAVLGGGL